MRGSRERFTRQTRRPIHFVRQGLAPRPALDVYQPEIRHPCRLAVEGAWLMAGVEGTSPRREGNDMHPEDVMKADLLSEIILVGSSGVILVSLLLIVVMALTRA
jgi:hypothetical protein